jgi:hypothetical protein
MAKQTFTTGQVLTAAQMTSLQQTAMGGGSATAKTTSYTLVAADAGTTVIMNSASTTTITVNTSLFAAGDTVLIVNQGAGVCTVTAGTATVSTAGSLALAQYETGILYFTSTSAAIFSDYTQASGSSAGLVFLDRQTFSAVSSYSLTSKFSATYDNYRIMLRITAKSVSGRIDARLRLATTDNSSNNYLASRIYELGSAVSGEGQTTTAVSSFQYFLERDTQSGFMSMDLYSPFQTEYTAYTAQSNYYYSAYGTHNQLSAGQMSVTTSYDGITFLPTSGTITGEVYLYGYARS